MSFDVPNGTEYIKCNVNQTGFYRVTYPEEMWTSIITTLLNNHNKFSPADRSNLIDDAFTLCEAGELNATIPLELSLYLLNERDYVPWMTALKYLHSWRQRLSESAGYKRYIIFFKRLLTPVARYVGWEDEGPHLKKSVYLSDLSFFFAYHIIIICTYMTSIIYMIPRYFLISIIRLLRIAVLQSAVAIKLDDVIKPAKTLFEDWTLKNKRIAPNIRDVVYAAGK